MIYRVRHLTAYRYKSPVELGSHLAHLLPREIDGVQRVLSSRLDTTPEMDFRRDERDHFGNSITWLSIETPHKDFSVLATSTVEVGFPPPPSPGDTPPWETIAAAASGAEGWAAQEFALPSPRLPPNDAVRDYARASFGPGTPVLAGVLSLNARIHREFRFKAGATTLRTTVGELLVGRVGVCQDFTHLMLSCLRSLGLPARYMSGYIRTYPAPGTPKRAGSDVSHAWVGAWLGPALGWIGVDPTNDIVVRDEHVVLGWGRDFSDVSPLFGVIMGGGKHTLDVSVDLSPET